MSSTDVSLINITITCIDDVDESQFLTSEQNNKQNPFLDLVTSTVVILTLNKCCQDRKADITASRLWLYNCISLLSSKKTLGKMRFFSKFCGRPAHKDPRSSLRSIRCFKISKHLSILNVRHAFKVLDPLDPWAETF